MARTGRRIGHRHVIAALSWANTGHRWWSLVTSGPRRTAWRRP